jgi:hypothetical protein
MAAPGAQAAAQAFLQPMDLTDDKMRGFLDAMDELRGLGDAASAFTAANPSRPEAFVKGMSFSGQAGDIIRNHGFSDPAEFQRVAYNAAMAYSVLQNGGKDALARKMGEAEAKRAEAMAKLSQHLSPEQLAMMEAQIDAGMKAAGSLTQVSDQNLELVKKYRERMEKMTASKGAGG